MSKYGSFCFLILFLTGCAAGTPWLPGPTAHTVVKPGSTLILNKAVTIFPPEAGARLQNGRIADHKYNQWFPNCRLMIGDPATTNQVIQPGEFTISQVGVEFQIVHSELIKLASVGISFTGISSATAEVMRTNFFLHSQSQPHVTRLACQHWENPHDSRHLMLSEIEQAVGDFITIQLKPSP